VQRTRVFGPATADRIGALAELIDQGLHARRILLEAGAAGFYLGR